MGSEVHYHYTSVETLFKIVEGRKLRLSNISFMDDKTEFEWLWRLVEEEIIKRRTSENSTEIDRKNLGDLQIKIDRWRGPNAETGGRPIPYLFCGSFTELEDDHGQWTEYAAGGSGVAIGVDLSKITLATKDRNLDMRRRISYDVPEQRRSVNKILDHFIGQFIGQTARGEFFSDPFLDLFQRIAWQAATCKDPKFLKEKEVRLVLRHPLATTVFSGDVVSGDYCTVDESALRWSMNVIRESASHLCTSTFRLTRSAGSGLAPNLEMIKLRLTFNSSW